MGAWDIQTAQSPVSGGIRIPREDALLANLFRSIAVRTQCAPKQVRATILMEGQ